MARNNGGTLDEWLKAAGQNGWDITRLAEEFGISRRELEYRTRKSFGSSPQVLIDRQRVFLACVRLAEDVPVKAVFGGFGFKQRSHFSRKVKQRSGLPPTGLLEVMRAVEREARQRGEALTPEQTATAALAMAETLRSQAQTKSTATLR